MDKNLIEIWYGDEQNFGFNGNPQRWINILGCVKQHEKLISLSYSLNGEKSEKLNISPFSKRLLEPGDFNADIAVQRLKNGKNSCFITADYGKQGKAEKEVIINYKASGRWPLPYSIKWNKIKNINDAVQIVEGKWIKTGDGIRPLIKGYDRLFAVGDRDWTDYRIKVPITFHGFSEWEGGLTGGFGLLARWTGHYSDEHQPHMEWRPGGTIAWYRAHWEEENPSFRYFNISDTVIADRKMVGGEPYIFKPDEKFIYDFSVKSFRDKTSLYTFKVWSENEPEKLLCDLSVHGKEGESPKGSILFIAYYADITVGDISIEHW